MKKTGLNPTQDELDTIMIDVDKDNDGTVDYEIYERVFQAYLLELKKKKVVEEEEPY